MRDCLFCKIVRGEIPGSKVFEDENYLAFLDLHPAAPGHTLVIPKIHYKDPMAMDADACGRLLAAGRVVAAAVFKAANADGINFLINSGAAAGQTVLHTHLHIMPRRQDTEKFLFWRPGSYVEGEMEAMRKKVIEMLS